MDKIKKDRTCYQCLNKNICFLKKDIKMAIDGGMSFLNIDSDDAPCSFTEIYTALANACLFYKFI